MASPVGAELTGCELTIDPVIGSTTVMLLPFVVAPVGTATYSFCWFGLQRRSVPGRSSTLKFVTGELMMKLIECDVPPPGGGFCTATFALPVELRSDAGICAVSEVLDTYVEDSVAPFHSIIEAGMKLPPVTVTVSVELPAVAEFGVTPVSVGIGFGDEVPLFDPPLPPQPSPRQSKKDSVRR